MGIIICVRNDLRAQIISLLQISCKKNLFHTLVQKYETQVYSIGKLSPF